MGRKYCNYYSSDWQDDNEANDYKPLTRLECIDMELERVDQEFNKIDECAYELWEEVINPYIEHQCQILNMLNENNKYKFINEFTESLESTQILKNYRKQLLYMRKTSL
jgi:hypothetical protein